MGGGGSYASGGGGCGLAVGSSRSAVGGYAVGIGAYELKGLAGTFVRNALEHQAEIGIPLAELDQLEGLRQAFEEAFGEHVAAQTRLLLPARQKIMQRRNS